MAQVHYEVLVRRKSKAPFSLALALEDRAKATAHAEALLVSGEAVAVQVTKETMDAETGEFRTVVILAKGEAERATKPKKRGGAAPAPRFAPVCAGPQDLYAVHVRERIGVLLERWLERKGATPFELLHSPDLVERLEASPMDLRIAIQTVAAPEAETRGAPVAMIAAGYEGLVKLAIERVLNDRKAGRLAFFTFDDFAETAESLVDDPDRRYRLGAGVAALIGPLPRWRDKVEALLLLADAAPPAASPKARALALQVIGAPLADIVGTTSVFNDWLGEDADLGQVLAAATRLAAPKVVEQLSEIESTVDAVMPPLTGRALRLAQRLAGNEFPGVRAALIRRVMSALAGPARLRPADADGEIAVLRALAMVLSTAADERLPLQEVQVAFNLRSKTLVQEDFVQAYLGRGRSAMSDVEALFWLGENVVGAANKREIARRVQRALNSERFEVELRAAAAAPAGKLAELVRLQRAVGRAGFEADDAASIAAKIGEWGGQVEARVNFTAALARAETPVVTRLVLLLQLAAGEAAPSGPAADRAKAEALKLLRAPETRTALGQAPEMIDRVRGLMKTVGLAA